MESLLTAEQAAKILDFPIRRIYRYCKLYERRKHGGLRHHRFEGTIRIAPSDLDDFIHRHDPRARV